LKQNILKQRLIREELEAAHEREELALQKERERVQLEKDRRRQEAVERREQDIKHRMLKMGKSGLMW